MTSRIRLSPRLTGAGVAIALAWPSSAVLADESPHEKNLWQITVGAGAVNMPESAQTRALPMVSVRYGQFSVGEEPGPDSAETSTLAARAGLFPNYHISWRTLRASELTQFADEPQGAIATFDAGAAYRPASQLILSAGPGVTWANEECMQGASLVRRSVVAQYLLSRDCMPGDAAASPSVDYSDQLVQALIFSYRF